MASRRFPTACDEQAIRQLIQQFTRTLGNKQFCCKIVNGNRPRPGSQGHPIVPENPIYPSYPDSGYPNMPEQAEYPGQGQPGYSGQDPAANPQVPETGLVFPLPEGFEWISQFSGLIQYVVSRVVENVMLDVVVQGKADLKELLKFLLEAFRGNNDDSIEKILKDCLNGKMPKSTEGNAAINGMQDQVVETLIDYIMLVIMFEIVKFSQLWITTELQQDRKARLFGRKKSSSGNSRGSRGRGGILQTILKAAGVDM